MTRTAIIHSLDQTDNKFQTVTVLEHNGNNDVVVEYQEKKYHAVDNPFTGYLYVDDIYGLII
jgi:hypothetical protein